MNEIKFRAWHLPEKKMYARAFQKWFHVLLCEEREGKMVPVRRARYEDCVFQESTTLIDKNGREIFEGDRVKVEIAGRIIEDVVGEPPDMWRSRKLHPLQSLVEKYGIDPKQEWKIEVIGSLF